MGFRLGVATVVIVGAASLAACSSSSQGQRVAVAGPPSTAATIEIPTTTITMPATTVPSVTVTVTVPVPRVTAPTVPRLRPTTTAAPRPPTTAAPKPAVSNGRPPCPGSPSGYNGYGCVVTVASGRVTLEFEEYGQVLQTNRDRLQLWMRGTLAPGVAARSIRFDHGDGTATTHALGTACGGDSTKTWDSDVQYVYPNVGSYQVTATLTTSRCDAGPQGEDPQTLTATIPVRACAHADATENDVICS